MAKQPGYQGNTQKGTGELKSRLLFVLGALIVFRIGSFIPVPGIDASVLSELVRQQQGTIIDMFNMFSGGALSRASIFALGIMPYISASIIIQLLTAVHPALAELKKEGEAGRRKISKYTRYATLLLAFIQSIGISLALPNMLAGLVPNPNMLFYVTSVISLVTGTMFLMWLGEQITERGIGNGISLIIFAGIVADLPSVIGQTIEQSRQGEISLLVLLLIAVVAFAVTYFVVFVERGQRRIVVNYVSRQQGRMMAPARQSHLPLKVNMAGVIPAIFASSIILFPATIAQWFGTSEGFEWLFDLSQLLQPGQPLYIVLFTMAVIFFAFFYTGMQYNPRDTADNLKKSGAFVPGYRPGEQTSRYIDKVMTRLTLIGALYITFVCLVPYIITSLWKVSFQLGGTSLLIVVVVIMDFIAQVQSHLMSLQYDSVLKKANLKGLGQ
ncbi:preprotein translocase subunit SecY [Glaesserella parasuis]|nr:preprotein translocase subunit SecY [Glaesserella parasuis]MCT8844277.1 preprotein translocase subunit SecY [Glaesserella parasuis]MDE3964740.1 preprotein translocase subunit SecY [Glaesserella parasuis]MDE3979416.1 preprotein translocase subunit SecY [Glaesserella parasuis]MDE4003271.1 preprotein translocase subunit SecY [Glaesserella parasuis]